MNALTRMSAPITSPAIRKQAKDFIELAKADNTKRAYRAAWQDFQTYCSDHNAQHAPANIGTVAEYISFCATGGLRVSTIRVRLAAISLFHRINKLPDPTQDESVRETMKGIRRNLGIRPQQKSAITDDILLKLVETFKDDITGIRNKAMCLVSWAGAFRRNEISGFNLSDLNFQSWGVKILLRKSKTDQEGIGIEQPIPYLSNKAICPVLALKKWIEVANIQNGALFRRIDRWDKVGKNRLTTQVFGTVVKKAVSAIGLDSDKFAHHSMRAGIITTLAQLGASAFEIQSVTRQKSMNTILGYQRSAGILTMQTVKKAFGE